MERVDNFQDAVAHTFDHLAYLLKNIRESMDAGFDALFVEDLDRLKKERKRVKQFQLWTNIIIANIFKVLRLMQKEDIKASYNYYQIIRRLQKISDGHRDIIIRSTRHVANRHKGLLPVQVEELKKVRAAAMGILSMMEEAFQKKKITHEGEIAQAFQEMRQLIDQCNENQIERIRDDSSKTRLSILFYGISGNCLMMMRQNVRLMEIFEDAFAIKGGKS